MSECYQAGAVAGIVVATVVVTVAVVGLAVAWFWNRTRGQKDKGRDNTGTHAQTSGQQSAEFAFDNPYFRNQDQDDGAGKFKSALHKNSLRSSKDRKAGRSHFVFGNRKQKALDDSCCLAPMERCVVRLKGHDFTGLGFNICGNMRDGILVKDVLHRGPASESGLIKAGDKIVSVTVSFSNMVYEDALTILSYSSPYDVQLELERPTANRGDPVGGPSTPQGGGSSVDPSRRLGSCSFGSRGSRKLFHPLYRSQSIDDLTQIEEPALKGVSSTSGNSSRMPPEATGSLNEKMLVAHWEKRFEDTLDDDPPTSTQKVKGNADDSNKSFQVNKSASSDGPLCKSSSNQDDNGGRRESSSTEPSTSRRSSRESSAESREESVSSSLKQGDNNLQDGTSTEGHGSYQERTKGGLEAHTRLRDSTRTNKKDSSDRSVPHQDLGSNYDRLRRDAKELQNNYGKLRKDAKDMSISHVVITPYDPSPSSSSSKSDTSAIYRRVEKHNKALEEGGGRTVVSSSFAPRGVLSEFRQRRDDDPNDSDVSKDSLEGHSKGPPRKQGNGAAAGMFTQINPFQMRPRRPPDFLTKQRPSLR